MILRWIAAGPVSRLWLITLCLAAGLSSARASPWAETGDAGLRSDIQLLANAGIIDNITSHWPLPWVGILDDLRRAEQSANQPYELREAIRRVRAAGEDQSGEGTRLGLNLGMASRTAVIRGFDALGRAELGGQVFSEIVSGPTAGRLALGGLKNWNGRTAIMPEGSYLAQRIGNALLYGGYTSHWWGPGWITALSLSSNARPFPHVGIARIDTAPFETAWLSWLGPWQAEFFVGLLDDSRIDTNTILAGARATINPLEGLEIGISRITQMCGSGHSCDPLVSYFDFRNDLGRANTVSEQGAFDIRYTSRLLDTPFEIYLQAMNEDSNPIVHSGSSHMFGGSVWLPLQANMLRLTLEYADSIATRNLFGFDNRMHGVAYNNGTYPDGMRYRGRTLGFSLDSDSTLLSLQASLVDSQNRTFTFSLHRAAISHPSNAAGNVITIAPVKINAGELRVTWPFDRMKLDLAARLADDKPRPGTGYEAAIEAALTLRL